MFTYSDTQPPFIIACDLSNVKFIGEDNVTSQNGGVSANILFPINSIWKDRSLLFDTVKIYSARTGWKACLKQLYNIHLKTDSRTYQFYTARTQYLRSQFSTQKLILYLYSCRDYFLITYQLQLVYVFNFFIHTPIFYRTPIEKNQTPLVFKIVS